MGARAVIGRLSLVLTLVVSACAGESPSNDGALGALDGSLVTVEAGDAPLDTVPDSQPGAGSTVDLAPSQTVGGTVPNPVTPVPCDIDDLEMWTSQAARDGVAVIRVRNAGDVRCDADIRRSPNLDPLVEPDVWLERKGTADLIVSPSAPGCADPTVESAIEVWIGDDVTTVATVVVACGWSFTAFYPNERVRNGCERDALELGVVSDAVVVRNRSALPCALTSIVEIDGAPVAEGRTPDPTVSELMPGDVVAFGRRSGEACDGTSEVELYDEVVGPLVFDDVPCDLVFELGGPRPWFGPGDGGPLDALRVFDNET